MWSATVLEPAFPRRSSTDSGSPVPSGPWSTNAHNGWKPNPRLNVGAACSFSECDGDQRGVHVDRPAAGPRRRRGRGPASPASDHALGRAAARAASIAASAAGASAARVSISRDTVGSDATGPNTCGCGPQLGDVGQAVPAHRQRHRQIQQHLARIVAGQRPPPRRQRRAQRGVQTRPSPRSGSAAPRRRRRRPSCPARRLPDGDRARYASSPDGMGAGAPPRMIVGCRAGVGPGGRATGRGRPQ